MPERWDAATLLRSTHQASKHVTCRSADGCTSRAVRESYAVGSILAGHLQITAHLEPMRREARLLLWDVDGSGREGWVDGRLCAQYASIDDFRGTIKCIPMRSNWWVRSHLVTATAATHRGCCIPV